MTADHWTYVIAAYGLAAVVLATYWRFLSRREKELADGAARQEPRQTSGVSQPASGRPSP